MELRRYGTDLTDKQWETLWTLLMEHVFTQCLGRPRVICLREIFDAILYVVRTDCQWRMLPHDFPKWQTVCYDLRQFRIRGTWKQISDLLRIGLRVNDERDACPSAGIIDGQSVKTTEAGGPHGYDAGKKINGRKRHILVDTMGLLLAVVVHVAAIQDRDGAKLVMMRIAGRFPRLSLIWADGGYAGKLVGWAQAFGCWIHEIVKRTQGQKGFVVLSRRWVVERTFAWLGRSRRLSKDLRGIGEDQRGHGSYQYDPLDDQAIVAIMISFQDRLLEIRRTRPSSDTDRSWEPEPFEREDPMEVQAREIQTVDHLELILRGVSEWMAPLREYHAIYAPPFGRTEHHGHPECYMKGLLSPEPERKSIEPMVLHLMDAKERNSHPHPAPNPVIAPGVPQCQELRRHADLPWSAD